MIKKRYQIHIFTTGLAFNLIVNGVSLQKDRSGSNFSMALFINQWLQPGVNSIQFKISGINGEFNKYSTVRLQIGYCPEDSLDFNPLFEKSIGGLDQRPTNQIFYTLDVTSLPEFVKLSDLRNVSLNDGTMLRKLYLSIRKLHTHFQEKNIDQIIQACAFRCREYDIAMYRPKGTAAQAFKMVLEAVFANEVILNYLEHRLTPLPYAAGKILSFEDVELDLPAILSTPPDQSGTRSFYFYWAIGQDGEPFIYR